MGASQNSDLHELKITERPPRTWTQTLNAICAGLVFVTSAVLINSFQLVVLLPLRVIPLQATQNLYDEGVRYSKGAFASLINLMNQWFAPTQLKITFEREGQGKVSEEDIERFVERDGSGKISFLRLPQKSVITSNHQVYSDWWYIWGLTYYMGTHKDVFIVLKKSLKWVPIIGPGMQIFRFIFLARSWAHDKLILSRKLAKLGRQAELQDKPFTFILFPEGTLVSKDTKPISKKYAEKIGISDLSNLLLPRSTGLLYSLRSLAPRMPSLKLIDITMVYPGVPPMGYGQSWYTLRSIFCDRVPPPVVNMHIRIFDVSQEVPIGDISGTNPKTIPNGSARDTVEIDVPEYEREAFDLWLRKLWTDKDEFITKFHATESDVLARRATIDIPLALKSDREIPNAFCFFVPTVAVFLWAKLAGLVWH
ncbi:hypothetical protein CONPUDRAFT_44786 [Coniophora puteana RWD-64-598 SS2]|uniref:Phospholipid/glycerol acyltransferase domain-containing protein n=1 Tax=Coniophora puteana (strain RWD-64-598) TaxID=741705 RepID=A0A5M3N5A3_CONPW|nr:uncharacterized protein CONPUDRAFT_44786 [Coniophora puteana RWD-64-598 SS2]EIW86486.1 hypothetical protein CONPUDRAFT_44786 [Coniophora puteana RWD-64-598 SS2]